MKEEMKEEMKEAERETSRERKKCSQKTKIQPRMDWNSRFGHNKEKMTPVKRKNTLQSKSNENFCEKRKKIHSQTRRNAKQSVRARGEGSDGEWGKAEQHGVETNNKTNIKSDQKQLSRGKWGATGANRTTSSGWADKARRPGHRPDPYSLVAGLKNNQRWKGKNPFVWFIVCVVGWWRRRRRRLERSPGKRDDYRRHKKEKKVQIQKIRWSRTKGLMLAFFIFCLLGEDKEGKEEQGRGGESIKNMNWGDGKKSLDDDCDKQSERRARKWIKLYLWDQIDHPTNQPASQPTTRFEPPSPALPVKWMNKAGNDDEWAASRWMNKREKESGSCALTCVCDRKTRLRFKLDCPG